MRLAVVYLSRYGLQLLATNHDSFLVECLREELPKVRAAIDAALRRAVEQLLPGAPMRWSVDVFEDRYEDKAKKAKKLWGLIGDVLRGSGRVVCGVS
jgi:hypothetical protein